MPGAGILKLPSAKFGRTPHGGIAIYSCNYTHSIRGARIRRCEGTGPIGLWSGQEPKCICKSTSMKLFSSCSKMVVNAQRMDSMILNEILFKQKGWSTCHFVVTEFTN